MGVRRGQAQRFAGVKLKKINGLAHVGVGFRPVFSHFKVAMRRTRRPVANHLRRVQQQGNPCFNRSPAPALECLEGGRHGQFHMLSAGLLVNSDNLSRARRVQGSNLFLGLEPLPPMTRPYSRPSWLETKFQAACILRAFSGV